MPKYRVKLNDVSPDKLVTLDELGELELTPETRILREGEEVWGDVKDDYYASLLIKPSGEMWASSGPYWGDFKEDHCRGGGKRQFSSILWNIPHGQSWEDTAKRTPATVRGHYFNRPTRVKNTGTNIWGEFDVPDTSCDNPSNWGRFIGEVVAKWLPDGRRMQLMQPFSYIDPHGQRWDAPEGWVIDGATIPRALWTIVGAPYTGKYRFASVIHDVEVDRKTRPWQDVQRVFYNAMRAAGVNSTDAGTFFNAVWLYQNTMRW